MLKFLFFIFIYFISIRADVVDMMVVDSVVKSMSINNKKDKNFIIFVFDDKIKSTFDKFYKNKTIFFKPVLVKKIDNVKEIDSGNLVYISKKLSKDYIDILRYTKDKNMITMSSIDGFCNHGGIVEITSSKDKKLKIKINTYIAQKKNILINPSIFRVAEVRGGGWQLR